MISLGIDIGTTTLRAVALNVSVSAVGDRHYVPVTAQPLCSFTPYTSEGRLDEARLFECLTEWMKTGNIPAPEIGTVLFTGEAQRSLNCLDIAEMILERWPALLCAQLDPHLESVVAAHGARAVELSANRPGRPVCHIDIGGGTSNFAWIEDGKIVDTACLDVGGRKWVVDPATGEILRRTRAGAFFKEAQFTLETANRTANRLAGLLLDFLGPEPGKVPPEWVVLPWRTRDLRTKPPVISLSGGVVECWTQVGHPFRFGDIGPVLSRALRDRLERDGLAFRLSREQGRATALGISAFGFQVSGNSLHGSGFHPLKNIPLWTKADLVKSEVCPTTFAIELNPEACDLKRMEALAQEWMKLLGEKPLTSSHTILFVMKPNIAKTFGYLCAKRLPLATPRIWAIDNIDTSDIPTSVARTLDLGAPTPEGFLPVVIKTLRLF